MKPKQRTEKQPQPPPDIFAEADDFCAGMYQLARAEQRALASVEIAENKLNAARRVRADAVAEALVSDEDVPEQPPLPEDSALRDARGGLISLRRKIREQDVHILTLRERLEAARQEFNGEQIARFAEASKSELAAFRDLLTRRAAMADALGVEPNTVLALPTAVDWADDKSATALHEQHCGPRKTADALAKFANGAEGRMLEMERAKRVRVPFDPSAKFTVIKPFLSGGRSFVPGALVDRFAVDLAVLAKLHHARFVATTNEELA